MAGSWSSHEKLNEIFLVLLSDTVIDPGAVMVHPPYAVFAYPAVMGPGRPVHLTPDGGRLYRNLTWGFRAHLVQIVQSSFGAMLPPSLWLSEKSILWLGRGTIPGSEKTARACAMKSKKMTMLNMTTWKLPHRLPDMVCRTIHLQSSNNQFVVVK